MNLRERLDLKSWRWKSINGAFSRYRWREEFRNEHRCSYNARWGAVSPPCRPCPAMQFGALGTPRPSFSIGMKPIKAAKTSALLVALFFIVYPSCNWITAHRAHVGTLFFEWERHIPFVPLMIIP